MTINIDLDQTEVTVLLHLNSVAKDQPVDLTEFIAANLDRYIEEAIASLRQKGLVLGHFRMKALQPRVGQGQEAKLTAKYELSDAGKRAVATLIASKDELKHTLPEAAKQIEQVSQIESATINTPDIGPLPSEQIQAVMKLLIQMLIQADLQFEYRNSIIYLPHYETYILLVRKV